MQTETAVACALLDLVRAAARERVSWAVIGGEALCAHCVPRTTTGLDVLVFAEGLAGLSETLVRRFAWVSLEHDDDVRRMRCPLGLIVELRAAQHPIETASLNEARPQPHHGVTVPVAPLGGVLLAKLSAGRLIDLAAIEQTAEHLPRAALGAALAWAAGRDPARTEELREMIEAARSRRRPLRVRRAPASR